MRNSLTDQVPVDRRMHAADAETKAVSRPVCARKVRKGRPLRQMFTRHSHNCAKGAFRGWLRTSPGLRQPRLIDQNRIADKPTSPPTATEGIGDR
jgi:hypothetical protein